MKYNGESKPVTHIPYGHQCIDDADIAALVDAARSDWLTRGPKSEEFESALCEYTGAKYAVVVSSGTAALHIACLCAGVGAGDEVITTPMTFVASANSIMYCGARPVFADVLEDTVNIDPDEIKKRVSKSTKAIIPVHYAGHPAELDAIKGIADRSGLIVIEDAAHALGATYKGSAIGSCKYSDMTVFSFHPVKHITTGEGGAITTNREDLYKKLVMLRNHGITKDQDAMGSCDGPWCYEQQLLGFNYHLTDFQCALGISQLKKLDQFVKRRREIAAAYDEAFASSDEIVLPVEKAWVGASRHLYFLRLRAPSCRCDLFNRMRSSGVGVQVHYIPVHLQPYYRKRFGHVAGDYPIAEKYYTETMTIPLHPSMTQHEIEHVIQTTKRHLRSPYC